MLRVKYERNRNFIGKENGLVLSVDNGHAFHPAHNEKADPVNKTSLNGGVVIKRHPNYATDGLSAAVLKKLLQTNNVKYQEYFNRQRRSLRKHARISNV